MGASDVEGDADEVWQTQIRYLISTGKTQWESVERYIDGL